MLLPTDREQIDDPMVRTWMESPERSPLIEVALAPSDANDGRPRMRGWLQREINAGLREAPIAQAVPVEQ